MRMSYGVTLMGMGAVRERSRDFEMRARNLAPIFSLITQDFRRMMVLQFDTQGRYLNRSRWASLAPLTVETKAREELDPRILHATRRLRQSFTQGREGQRIQTPYTLALGSNVPYAQYLSSGRSNMEARPIVPEVMPPRHVRRWTVAIDRYLSTGKRKLAKR